MVSTASPATPAATRVHNFSAGPAILPQSVMRAAAEAIHDFNGTGLSILEVSHRSKGVVEFVEQARSLALELLGFDPERYTALFLGGGASSQFFMAPANLLAENDTAHYLDTGTWSAKAIKEAKLYGKVNVVASSRSEGYTHIPHDYSIPESGAYFHCQSNNTIYGTQLHDFPTTDLPIVCDMSSDIFSRPIPADRFGLVYAGAQKNMGPAGVALVIVRRDLLGKAGRTNPSMVDYATHVAKDSMFNTPPVFPILVSLLTMRWVQEQGGVEAMAKRNEAKSRTLYGEIDRNPLFEGTVAARDRSHMNACFKLLDESHKEAFAKLLAERKLSALNGHRSVGGYRASMYNAMDLDSVELLVEAMQTLEQGA